MSTTRAPRYPNVIQQPGESDEQFRHHRAREFWKAHWRAQHPELRDLWTAPGLELVPKVVFDDKTRSARVQGRNMTFGKKQWKVVEVLRRADPPEQQRWILAEAGLDGCSKLRDLFRRHPA
jgi:hypothetical protein